MTLLATFAALAPAPMEVKGEEVKATPPEAGYVGRADDGTLRTGCFLLKGDHGTAVYVSAENGGATFVMRQGELTYVGDDNSGKYHHYRFLLPGGLNWYFPKTASSPTQLQYIYTKVEAPGTPFERYGRAESFPSK